MAARRAIDVRANASVFRSRVKSVPGPDNRLDQQPDCTANLGADYRFRGVPLTIGGNINWTPGYTRGCRRRADRVDRQQARLDAYALWTFNPALALRLTASNLGCRATTSPAARSTAPTCRARGARDLADARADVRQRAAAALEMKL